MAGVGNKLLRERGNATAAVLLSRMAQRNAAEAALHTFDDVATRAASGMMKAAGKTEAAEGLAARNAARQAERGLRHWRSQGVHRWRPIACTHGHGGGQASPGPCDHAGAYRREARHAEAIGAHACQCDGLPDAADGAVSRIQDARGDEKLRPISAPSRKPSVNPVQAARFLRYQEVAEDPQSALVRFSRGEVRREDVEFMRECTPRHSRRCKCAFSRGSRTHRKRASLSHTSSG